MVTASLPCCARSAARGITLMHDFAAPSWLVYEAFTRPELVRRWWGTSGLTTSCRADLRTGGSFAYESFEVGHQERHFGTYSVVGPQRLIFTLCREDELVRQSAVVTVSFFEENNRTYVTATYQHASAAALEAALESGIEQTDSERFERLATFVSALL
jgi:uncharacterized protein YndB with AHSA1/START domain